MSVPLKDADFFSVRGTFAHAQEAGDPIFVQSLMRAKEVAEALLRANKVTPTKIMETETEIDYVAEPLHKTVWIRGQRWMD